MSIVLHGGCYFCGSTKEEVLTSKHVLIRSLDRKDRSKEIRVTLPIALCSEHIHACVISEVDPAKKAIVA